MLNGGAPWWWTIIGLDNKQVLALALVGYDAGMVWYVAMVGCGGGVNNML